MFCPIQFLINLSIKRLNNNDLAGAAIWARAANRALEGYLTSGKIHYHY